MKLKTKEEEEEEWIKTMGVRLTNLTHHWKKLKLMRPSWVVKMIEGGNPEIDDENDEQAEHKRKKSDQSDGDEEPKNQRKRLSKKTPDDQPRDGAIDRPMPKFQTIGECEKFEVKWSDEFSYR